MAQRADIEEFVIEAGGVDDSEEDYEGEDEESSAAGEGRDDEAGEYDEPSDDEAIDQCAVDREFDDARLAQLQAQRWTEDGVVFDGELGGGY
jgi:hypothetical protein